METNQKQVSTEVGQSVSRYALKRKTSGFIISEEVAEEQVLDLLTYYDIDLSKIKDPVKIAFVERVFDQLRDYIRRGQVEIKWDNESRLEVAQHLSGGQEVIYSEVSAKAKLAMDRAPQEARYARIYAIMGSLSGLGSTAIEKLPARDLAVVEILGSVFLNA